MAMSLEQLAEAYFSHANVVEVTDQAEIMKMIESKTSCCWGAGQVIAEGWVQLCQPSRASENGKTVAFVCRQSNIPA
jgi:hypothetical protein